MKRKLYLGFALIFIYIVFTISLLFVDRSAVGPLNSMVGYSSINMWFHNLTGVNWVLYNITDWGGIPPILMGILFGVIGLIQLIKRRSIFKVDRELIILGFFYITVFIIYMLFEFVVINRRPVLIEGRLETSYPSSTTFLSITFLLSPFVQVKKYVKNIKKSKIICVLLNFYMLFLVVGRLLSGVHWLSDILGSVFIGYGILKIYEFVLNASIKNK